MSALLLLLGGMIAGAVIAVFAYGSGESSGFLSGRQFAEQYTDAWWVLKLKSGGHDMLAAELYAETLKLREEQKRRDAKIRAPIPTPGAGE